MTNIDNLFKDWAAKAKSIVTFKNGLFEIAKLIFDHVTDVNQTDKQFVTTISNEELKQLNQKWIVVSTSKIGEPMQQSRKVLMPTKYRIYIINILKQELK
jgi:hypothetical protein